VLTLDDDAISSLTLFAKPDSLRLFEAFGLPLTLEEVQAATHRKQVRSVARR
jgi:hypothetical protein